MRFYVFWLFVEVSHRGRCSERVRPRTNDMIPDSVPFGTRGRAFRPELSHFAANLKWSSLGEVILDAEVPRDRALSQSVIDTQVDSSHTSADLKTTKMTGKQQHMRPTLSSAILTRMSRLSPSVPENSLGRYVGRL